MPDREIIRVFEYDEIKEERLYNGVKFKHSQLQAIQQFNSKNNHKYFTLTHKGVRFNNFVGVVQIGSLTIEILPKADRGLNINSTENEKNAWRDILLKMLMRSNEIDVLSLTSSHLKLRSASILDIYIKQFLLEVQKLLQIGLIKKYRFKKENSNYLKGRLIFNEQITKNLLHNERFYTSHQTYDYDNIYNQILYNALTILTNIASKAKYVDLLESVLFDLPSIGKKNIVENTFKQLIYSRNNEHYRKAIEIARMIILNYNPDIKAGTNYVLAILFDMNKLWEKFIFSELLRSQNLFGYKVSFQNSKRFWENKRIRPDIVLKKDGYSYIIDTKWKIIKSHNPSDGDLKQMYVYNMYWGANKGLLTYPNINRVRNLEIYGKYHKGNPTPPDIKGNYCKTGFIDVWDTLENDDLKLNEHIPSDIISLLELV